MKLNEILTLINAGYSRDEIMALDEGTNGTGAGENVPAEPETAPDPEPEISADEAPAQSEIDQTARLIAQLTAQVSSLTKQIQRSNLLNAQQPPVPEPDSAEKVLASIITPKH